MTGYDVIVIGAGPSGATTTYFLGTQGAKTLVIDKASLPRYKPCGGAVPRATYAQFPFDFYDVIESEPDSVTYCWQADESVTFPLDDRPITMVMRDRFDWRILQHAEATIWDETSVRHIEESPGGIRVITEAGDVVRADYLVGADGAISNVAKSAGLRGRRQLAAAIEAEVIPDADTWEQFASQATFDFGVLPHGYLWIFPKSDHLSAGIAQLNGKGRQLKEILFDEMRQLQIDLRGIQLHGHALPIYQGPEPLATKRILLVGDAAGLVDPFSGEGIRHAIASGRLAAQCVLEQNVSDYSRLIARYATQVLQPSHLLARIFYHFPRACFRYGIRNPRATRLLADWLNERGSQARMMTGLVLCLAESVMKRP